LHGFPRTGYVPLATLIEHRLSDEDVLVVATAITDAGPPMSHADRLVRRRRVGLS
jgi:hypothetical protein